MEVMNFKQILSLTVFELLCLGSFTAQIPAMEPLFKVEQSGQCVGACNQWTTFLRKLNCGHSFCSKCYSPFKLEKQQQLDHHITCPLCDTVLWQGNQLIDPSDPDELISNKDLIAPALNQCLDSNFQIILKFGACAGISFILSSLANKYRLAPQTRFFLAGLGSAGISAFFTQHKLKNISTACENIKNINSKILQQRLNAFKNNYYKNNILCGIGVPMVLTGLLYGTAKYIKAIDPEDTIETMTVVSYLGNWGIDIWGSCYSNIPKLK